MNRHMQQIDHQTGEVVEGFVAYVVPKRKNGFQKGWMAMAQEAMMMLAQSSSIKKLIELCCPRGRQNRH